MFIQDTDRPATCRDRQRGLSHYIKECEMDSISVWVFVGLAIAIIGFSMLAGSVIVRIQDAIARRLAMLAGDVRNGEEADVEHYQDDPIEAPESRKVSTRRSNCCERIR